MAYIGRGIDKLSNIEKLDTITFDGSSSYSLTKNSVAFTPSSANSLQVSIDGVVQAGNFTVSGSTIDFGTAVASTSTNDFIFHYGTGLITTPADGTVNSGALSADAITGQTEDTTPADDDLILVYDTSATALKKVQKSNFAGGGITGADVWRLSANFTGDANPISSNLERVDDATFAKIGTGMSVSSGVWTFPETGLWQIWYFFQTDRTAADDNQMQGIIYGSSDSGSNYDELVQTRTSGVSTPSYMTSTGFTLFNCTNTSTHVVKFSAVSMSSNTVRGNTDRSETSFMFVRLGDSQ